MKEKTNRFIVTLADTPFNALAEMMSDDMQKNRSAYIAKLIAEEVKRRNEEKSKRGVGRPRKAKTGDEQEPAIYPHPDEIMNKGRMLTETEILGYYQIRNEEVPDELLEQIRKNNEVQ